VSGPAVRFQPREIQRRGDDELFIRWEDGHESLFAVRFLRQRCPCASCVNEWTGESMLDPESIASDIKVEKAELVGNYAIAFQFSDGHSTGIFSFEKLRQLCPCGACRPDSR